MRVMRTGSVRRAVTRLLIIGAGAVLVLGATSYAIFRIQTPISLDTALERFHAGNDGVISERHSVDSRNVSKRRTTPTPGQSSRRSTGQGLAEGIRIGGAQGSQGSGISAERSLPVRFDVIPSEGVYTFDGSGEESFNGIRREFPPTSYRTITHQDPASWEEHHYFSEQRESWTRITVSTLGRVVHNQRNKIVIGPYPRDTDVPFRPPVRSAKFPPRSGQTWSGSFEGRTEPDGEDYMGTYEALSLGEEKWTVGSMGVRVVGFRLDFVFVGELNAEVTVEYWFAPGHGMTVHEDYSIDAKVGPLNYHGEWDVKLRSLVPST